MPGTEGDLTYVQDHPDGFAILALDTLDTPLSSPSTGMASLYNDVAERVGGGRSGGAQGSLIWGPLIWGLPG
jgi:hypothetical protein